MQHCNGNVRNYNVILVYKIVGDLYNQFIYYGDLFS